MTVKDVNNANKTSKAGWSIGLDRSLSNKNYVTKQIMNYNWEFWSHNIFYI